MVRSPWTAAVHGAPDQLETMDVTLAPAVTSWLLECSEEGGFILAEVLCETAKGPASVGYALFHSRFSQGNEEGAQKSVR